MVKKQEKKSNFLTIIVIVLVVSAAAYFYSNQTPGKERYQIKSAGGENGYKASFINITGKDAEDKKIGLSNEYWEGGKFK